MQIRILSGGEGKRLWPLSTNSLPKQFLKYIDDQNKSISMLQRNYNFIKKLDAPISIITSKQYLPIIKNQIGDVDCIIEPEARNTFPAVCLGVIDALYNKKIDENEYIVFVPVDSYVSHDFFDNLIELERKVMSNNMDVGIIGIEAHSPSTQYGYIKLKESLVEKFIEKPSIDKAKEYVQNGYLFNAGIFMVKIKFIKNVIDKYIEYNDYNSFIDQFNKLPRTSFDYEVLEKIKEIVCLPVVTDWMDIGAFSNFLKIIKQENVGNVKSIDDKNTIIINELNIPVVSLRNENLFICASESGFLVMNRNDELDKSLIEDLCKDNDLPLRQEFIIKRDETLMINVYASSNKLCKLIYGRITIICDDERKNYKEKDCFFIKKGKKYIIKAIIDAKIIETFFLED